MIEQSANSPRTLTAQYNYLIDLSVLAGVVLAASLFGIFTRPIGLLASFWPANAILLGLMIRHQRFASPFGWATAFAAYVAADLMTGGTLAKTLWLTGANIAGVAVGQILYRFVPADHKRLREPQSVIIMFVICCCAAFASALVGGFAIGVVLERNFFTGLELWFVTELVNFIIVLPVILITPPISEWPRHFNLSGGYSKPWGKSAWPVIALILSMLASSLIGGPGAFAFPVPALLWCATSFQIFPTTLLTLVFSIWGMLTFSSAGAHSDADPIMWVLSMRLGLGMIAMAPLAVASVTATRNILLTRLQDSVDHDFLTRALTRGTFMARAEAILSHANDVDGAIVLVLDIDHFKSVNDRFGHATGDRALVAFSSAIASVLRKNDLFGRTGGEEFCVVLPGTPVSQAEVIAERIRQAVERLQIDTGTAESLTITVSGGMAVRANPSAASFDEMLMRADSALYRAKSEGRNRVLMGT